MDNLDDLTVSHLICILKKMQVKNKSLNSSGTKLSQIQSIINDTAHSLYEKYVIIYDITGNNMYNPKGIDLIKHKAFLEQMFIEATDYYMLAKQIVDQIKRFESYLKKYSNKPEAIKKIYDQMLQFMCSYELAVSNGDVFMQNTIEVPIIGALDAYNKIYLQSYKTALKWCLNIGGLNANDSKKFIAAIA